MPEYDALPAAATRLFEEGGPADFHSVPIVHAQELSRVVRDYGLERSLETGMAHGVSTVAIAAVHEARGSGSHIAIDPYQRTAYGSVGLSTVTAAGLTDRVRFIEARADEALPQLIAEGATTDFAFIDGSHLFDFALVDFFFVDRMLEPGGFVALHDTWMPSVRRLDAFILANRSYAEHWRDDGMSILRKLAGDERDWDFHADF